MLSKISSALCIILCSTGLLAQQSIMPRDELMTCGANEAEMVFNLQENNPSLRDETMYTGVKAVVDMYRNNQKNNLALVDVRPANEYEQFRIPHSINIQLHQLKYKNYLKGKILVLVNSGKSYRDIEMTAANLRIQGFRNVSILDGGIRKWHEETNLIDGKVSGAERLNLISVKEFLAEANHGPWLVFDLDKKAAFETKVHGELIHLPFDSIFELNLTSKINALEHKPMSRYLFVSNDKNIYKNIVPSLKKKGISNYHILSQTTDYINVFNKNNRDANIARNNVIKGCAFK